MHLALSTDFFCILYLFNISGTKLILNCFLAAKQKLLAQSSSNQSKYEIYSDLAPICSVLVEHKGLISCSVPLIPCIGIGIGMSLSQV